MATADEILQQARRSQADDILAAARAQPKGFGERVGERLGERLEQAKEIIGETTAGNQSVQEGILQMGGKVQLGSAFDIAGEGLVSAGRGVSAITPDVIEDPAKENLSLLTRVLSRTPPGDALNAVMQRYAEFAAENPRQARNIDAITNIALAAAPVKGTPRPVAQSATGERLLQSAERTTARRRDAFIDDLVTPKQTVKERRQQVPRTTEEGLLRQKVAELSPQQQASAAEIRTVPGVTPKKTIQGNYNAISEAVTKKARSLEKNLAALGERGRYAWEELGSVVENVMGVLRESPTLVGDAANSAVRVIDKAFRLAAAEEKTLAGLLRVRRDLDDWVLRHKPKAFEDNVAANAMTTAAREVRQELNNFIAQRAKGVNVQRSLQSQSNMLRAMDDIVIKAADEPGSIAARAIERAIKVIPVRNELVAALGLTFGMGGLGAASFFLPTIQKGAITAGITYGLGKAVMAPQTRKLLGEVISVMDRSAQKITDPTVLQQMRADKAALIEIINSSEQGED